MRKFRTVEEYLSASPKTVRDHLEDLRKTIQQTAPQAEEVISYNMPAFKWNGMLVWYAAFQKHMGFYPKASAIRAFKEELRGYKTSKGTIQLSFEKAVPAALVKKIVRFRMKENERDRRGKQR